MRTHELVRALAADRDAAPPPPVTLGRALAVGAGGAAILFWLLLGPRGDFLAALGETRFLFKFVVTLALAVTAAVAALALARPAAPLRLAVLSVAPALLAAAIATELAVLPPAAWEEAAVGSNALLCLVSVPLLAAPVLVAALIALRAGAPTRPALAGAVAGLLAGGLGAALYAAHCPDDSPLFVALWYGLAIAGVAAVGALAGRRLLAW